MVVPEVLIARRPTELIGARRSRFSGVGDGSYCLARSNLVRVGGCFAATSAAPFETQRSANYQAQRKA